MSSERRHVRMRRNRGAMSTLPSPVATDRLVSCICPTFNRRGWLPRAIELFLAQDYPCRELVIVDDGEDSVTDLIPDHVGVRYQRLTRRLSLGAKRNLACEYARGRWIA